ncbi:MAG: DUF5694 domain-containing protein [Saprospiraceae bacterium]
MKLLVLGIALLSCLHAVAQTPVLDLRGLDPGLRVAPTQVLVLASTHLNGLSKRPTSAALEPVRDKLAAFRPDVITIEALPGEVCETLLAYPSEYEGVADDYCRDMTPYRKESNLTMSAGLAEIRTTLADWPTSPTAAQRRRLAAAFLAANDRYSSLVQWLQLPEDERKTGEGLGEESVTYLGKLKASINENTQLGSMLAARLGLERVYAVDDHTADVIYASLPEGAWSRMGEIWSSNPDSNNVNATYGRLDSIGKTPGGMLDLYRAFASPEIQLLSTNADFRQAMNDTSDSGMGRRYLSWWQTRNLRMVASIMVAAAEAPGGKVLSIVGASHKAYFDAYLDQMHDVKLVDSEEVLR